MSNHFYKFVLKFNRSKNNSIFKRDKCYVESLASQPICFTIKRQQIKFWDKNVNR